MFRALYRGPSIVALHESFAKEGRLDENAPIRASRAVAVSAPIERVWSVLSTVQSWPKVDSSISDVQLPHGVKVDAPFLWANGKTRIRSRFAVVDRCRELTWTGEAMGARSVHRHLLHRVDARTTRLESEESMAGLFLTALYSTSKLEQALTSWLTAIVVASERPA